jgi:inner membrane protein
MSFFSPLLSPLVLTYGLAGLALLGLDVLLPGVFLVSIGASAVATGILIAALDAFGFTLGIQNALICFMALSLIAVYITRKTYLKSAPETGLNAPHNALIGKSFKLHTPILKGEGKIVVGDSLWQVHGNDQAEGYVRVIGVENGILIVEKI